jgi:hypothetical protein
MDGGRHRHHGKRLSCGGAAPGVPPFVSPFFGETGWERYLNLFLLLNVARPVVPETGTTRTDTRSQLVFPFSRHRVSGESTFQNYGCKATSWVECLVAWAQPELWSPALPRALTVWLQLASEPAPAHLTARCTAQPPAG